MLRQPDYVPRVIEVTMGDKDLVDTIQLIPLELELGSSSRRARKQGIDQSPHPGVFDLIMSSAAPG
jgi:hypothetical protein